MMRLVNRFAILAALLAVSFPVAADLSKARLFYDNGLLDDAKRELIEIIASDSDAEFHPGAMNLLGTIAADQKNYELAQRTWNDLISKYPSSPEAQEARAKLSLAAELVRSSPGQVAEPGPLAATDAVPASALKGVVVIGAGTETAYVDQVVTEVMNALGAEGLVVSRGQRSISVSELLSSTPASEVTSVLVLSLRFGYIENLRADCYDASGELVWDEKAAGSMGITRAGITQGLIERILRKIGPHIGGPCLSR
jgi:tetratricopeptide (TPR) repeat protein